MATIKDLAEQVVEQILADLETVDIQIEGTEDQIAAADTPELKSGLEDPPLAELNERGTALETARDALIALLSDGWPDPQSFTLSDELMVQFVKQNRNFASAAELFKPADPPLPATAERIDLTISEPHDELPP